MGQMEQEALCLKMELLYACFELSLAATLNFLGCFVSLWHLTCSQLEPRLVEGDR